MALTGAQTSALLVLLEAPSKQAVDAFFCSCFRERQRHAAGPIDVARVAEIVESLGLSTPLAAAPLQRAAIALIGKVLYADASAEQTAAQQAEAAPATPGAKGKTLRHKLALGKQHLLNLENQLHQTLMAGNAMDKTHVDRAVYLMQQVGAQQGHMHALEESVSQLLEGDGPVGGEVVSTVSTRSSELAQRLLLDVRSRSSMARSERALSSSSSMCFFSSCQLGDNS